MTREEILKKMDENAAAVARLHDRKKRCNSRSLREAINETIAMVNAWQDELKAKLEALCQNT